MSINEDQKLKKIRIQMSIRTLVKQIKMASAWKVSDCVETVFIILEYSFNHNYSQYSNKTI